MDFVEDDVYTVIRMIQFLYLGDYDDSDPPSLQSLVPVKEPLTGRAPLTTRRHLVIVRCFAGESTLSEIRACLSHRESDIRKCRVVCRDPMKIEMLVTDEKAGTDIAKYLSCYCGSTSSVKYKFQEPTPVKKLPASKVASDGPGPSKGLMTNAMVYVIGDKYDIPALRSLAIAKVRHCLRHLDMSDFSLTLQYVYENTMSSDRALRDVFITQGIKSESLASSPEFCALVSENGEIGLDLYKSHAKPARFIPTGSLVLLRCRRPGCHEGIYCPRCQEYDFVAIDEMEDGKELDLMCERIRCQEMFHRQDDIPFYCMDAGCRDNRKDYEEEKEDEDEQDLE